MSAIPLLSVGKQTLGELPEKTLIDPKPDISTSTGQFASIEVGGPAAEIGRRHVASTT